MKKQYWWKIGLSILFTWIFFVLFIPKINKPLDMNSDGYLVNLTVKHTTEAILSGNLKEIPNLPMFYGFKNTLFFSETYLTQTVLGIPIFAIFQNNPILSFNVLALLTIILSFFSMYLLCY